MKNIPMENLFWFANKSQRNEFEVAQQAQKNALVR